MSTTEKPTRVIDTGHLFKNRWARMAYRPLQPLVERAFRLPDVRRLIEAATSYGDDALGLAEGCLAELGVESSVDERDVEALRSVEGPLVVLANHPYGGIDAFALIGLLEKVRPGEWKLLANQLLYGIENLRARSLPVDPIGKSSEVTRQNRNSMRLAYSHLREGGTLAFFPSGKVSGFDNKIGAVRDRAWSEHAIRLAAKAGASCAVLHIPGQNSDCFLGIPTRLRNVRALFLSRELTKPPTDKVEARLAAIVPPAELARLGTGQAAADKLRAYCYARADADIPRPQNVPPPVVNGRAKTPVLPPAALKEARRLVEKRRIAKNSSYDLLFERGDAMPEMLQALGRAREVSFSGGGLGVGTEVDLAPWDYHCHHVLLWDREQERLAGAYRVGFVQEILAEYGREGFYLNQIFDIDPGFYRALGPSFEISRAFILPEYQRDSGALAGLWKGLGAAAVRSEVTTLFGAVSISINHHPATRAYLAEHLKQSYGDDESTCKFVRPRFPFTPKTRYHKLVAEAFRGEPVDALAPMIDRIENGERGIPPLIRYYCAVGARYSGFTIERFFQDALDCLLRVDLTKIPPKYKKRFLGKGAP